MSSISNDKQKKRVLAIVETSREFGRKLIEGISQYATEYKNWNLFLYDHDAASQNVRRLDDWNGDGIIVRIFNENLNQFFHKFPGKKINLAADDKEFPVQVRLNNEKCGQMAAEHFWERGYHHFAYFSVGHTYWSQFRYNCFITALKEYDSSCFLCPQAEQENSTTLPTLWQSGLDDSVLQWIKSLPKPIGIFCANDHHAFYLTSLCRSYEIGIPEEIAVLGVDNDESLCKAMTPSLSSIDPNAKQIGYRAAEILNAMMNEMPLPRFPVIVDPLCNVVRQSTDNIAVNDPILNKALRFIRVEVVQNLRVNDVVREVGVSRGTLNNLFQKHLRSTPLKEILRVRMEWAKELLRDTQFPITEISQMIGYQTPEYFSRAFTREVGNTPRDYRTEHQKR
ncbi:XylR family transcriptional regulator [Planctomycetales bacterium]|nr:XylR family transcriptional regulator [Planctomycetales bacterium]